jgi:hypothetical protein
MMKYSALVLLLFVGLVSSASAGAIDSKLYGTWVTYDGPCSPCEMNIQSSGVTFTQVGDTIDVISAVGTPPTGIHVVLQGGGDLDLALTKKSSHLVGFYKRYAADISVDPVSFDRKK